MEIIYRDEKIILLDIFGSGIVRFTEPGVIKSTKGGSVSINPGFKEIGNIRKIWEDFRFSELALKEIGMSNDEYRKFIKSLFPKREYILFNSDIFLLYNKDGIPNYNPDIVNCMWDKKSLF